MITANVRVLDRFPEITRDVENLAQRALDRAAAVAARTAEQLAQPGLKQHSRMEVVRTHGTDTGYAAGIRSTARGSKGQRIAHFHDKGTYGNYRGRNQPRRRPRAQKVAHVNPDTGERTGIQALGFFGAARREGRRELNRVIQAGL